MSEMVGNYFFITHSYARAIPLLEEVLTADPGNGRARKKLVIAYTECGRLRDAYRLYAELLSEDPAIITCTNPEAEDCPCPDLVNSILEGDRGFDDPSNRALVLGIYSSYCSASEAIHYFKDYLRLFPTDQRAQLVIRQLQTQIDAHNAGQ